MPHFFKFLDYPSNFFRVISRDSIIDCAHVPYKPVIGTAPSSRQTVGIKVQCLTGKVRPYFRNLVKIWLYQEYSGFQVKIKEV